MHLRDKVSKQKKRFAWEMRHNPTPPEAAMWQLLRRKQLGCRFVRQSVIRGFIADFYAAGPRLVVEVDGKMHNPQYDAWRDRIMNDLGLTVVRFPAGVVLNEPFFAHRVLKEIVNPLLTIHRERAILVNS